ncbi:hypothetical protein PRIPAC_86454, partial [Pristionchus pacificus]
FQMSPKKHNNKRKHDSSTSAESDEDEMFQDAPASNHSSPSKLVAKRESTDSDDSDEEGVQIKGKVQLISPLEAVSHLEKIKEKCSGKDTMKNAIAAYCAEMKGDAGKELQTSLTKYLHLAIQPAKLPFSTGSGMMNEYLSGVNALKHFPGFPHKPKNLLFCYAALNDIDNGLGMLKEAADRMKADDKGRKKAGKEADKQKVAYLENLQSFLDKHKDRLSEVQMKSVQKTITRMDKAIHPEKYPKVEKVVGGAKKKAKKEPKSAFDHFVSLAPTLYADLDPEKRLKKLRKKFDNLEDSVKDVYEKLALRD